MTRTIGIVGDNDLLYPVVLGQHRANMPMTASMRLEHGTQLSALYEQEVDRRLDLPESDRQNYADLIVNNANEGLRDGPAQYILIVDRSPLVQALMVYWKSPEGDFLFIGASPVATGKPGQFEHFETPLGVFDHTIDNLDFRAEGTVNEFGIRGYGRKGMRIYDFGWVKGIKGWGDHGDSLLRLQVHSTDPALLEPDLGHARSKGCIRIPATLNVFLDHYGILDADYELALAQGQNFWVLSSTRAPTRWSGRYLIVVETARTERPSWSPAPTRR